MAFDKLYKRTSTGAIQQWEIVVSGDSFYTVAGQLDGKLTTSKPTVCKAKSGTTPEIQAEREALSKWTKKSKSGYTPDINAVDTAVTFFEPMACKNYGDRKDKIDWSEKIFSQPKLDGQRCIVKADGMWSRWGNVIVSSPHIFQILKPLFDANPDLILDGELYTNKFKSDFNKIMSLVGKTKPTAEDLAESAKYVEFWVYDLPSCEEVYSKRYEELSKLLSVFKGETTKIRLVETVQIADEAHLDKLFDDYLEFGYEGQIVRLDDVYENKRSANILKRKTFQDAEFQIVGYNEGNGNLAGLLGTFACVTDEGKQFNAVPLGNAEYLKQLWDNRDSYIGKIATIKFANLTPDGKPRFAKMKAIRNEAEGLPFKKAVMKDGKYDLGRVLDI